MLCSNKVYTRSQDSDIRAWATRSRTASWPQIIIQLQLIRREGYMFETAMEILPRHFLEILLDQKKISLRSEP